MANRRFLILSDIHANLEALSAVLRAVSRRRYDKVICLGDLVGYGANPDAVVSRLRKIPRLVAVRGNHDKVAAGLASPENFNAAARRSAEWTVSKLSRDNMSFLRGLATGPVELDDGIVLCHGSIPDEDAYLFSDYDAYELFQSCDFKVCFFGHTHYPCAFRQAGDSVEFVQFKGESSELILEEGARVLINPGSLGQPRDRTPLASFGEYYPDNRRFVLKRIPYAVEKARMKIIRAGLPENLGNRLLAGT